MKFTNAEIDLCKKIAEKYKEQSRHLNHHFKYGNWYEYKKDVFLITSQPQSEMSPEITILWTISDCLRFLKVKHSFQRKKINYFRLKFVRGIFKFHYWKNWAKPVCYRGKTPLEACLKAVLAVLEESK